MHDNFKVYDNNILWSNNYEVYDGQGFLANFAFKKIDEGEKIFRACIKKFLMQ